MTKLTNPRVARGAWRLWLSLPQSRITTCRSLLLSLILLLAGFLRFYQLAASSLWSDEGNTWALLGRSFGQIAHDAAADIHPPGYYWVLKLWAGLFGTNAISMRSFSALCGVALVFVIYKIGGYYADEHSAWQPTALLAALLAALNPFQVYYSQEARMYMLLTLESAGLFWALMALMHHQTEAERTQINADQHGFYPRLSAFPFSASAYVLCGIMGLWTHYSFPIVLTAAGLAYLWQLTRGRLQNTAIRHFLFFALLNGVVLLAFAPWLLTAIDRIRHWPKGGEAIAALTGLQHALQTLLFGPLPPLPTPDWPWRWAVGGLPLLGLFALRRQPGLVALALWLLAPLALMFGLGLFNDAFLKFLLVASPAWCIAVAATPQLFGTGNKQPSIPIDKTDREHSAKTRYAGFLRYALYLLIIISASRVAALMLPRYYANPTARDNYAGVARYVQAMGNAATDWVLLDAPGQQEVWRYYDPGLPVLSLPQQRPPNPQQTIATLSKATQDHRQIFALFWATDEADPQRLVEQWLDQNTFKGWESWQGNLRFVTYRMPMPLTCTPLTPAIGFEQRITLLAQCQPAFPQRIAAGEVALIGLHWQALAKIERRYKVSIQLLDARNQVIAQHDSEPAGGSQPTDRWQPQTIVIDNHGLTIPFGTPPAVYRLIVAIYEAQTGQRLHAGALDQLELGQLEVMRPQRAIPVAILPIQHRTEAKLGGVQLLGYDLYRKNYAHAPDTPIQPNDLVQLTFYWQAPDSLPANWPPAGQFKLTLGGQERTAELVPGYPTQQWQPGDVLRGAFDIPFDGTDRVPTISIGENRLSLAALPR